MLLPEREQKLRNFIERKFELEPYQGKSKVTTLSEAIRQNVKPGNEVFLGWNANAIANELIRQYRGKKPGFTLIMTVTWNSALNLIHCGLVKKLTTTSCSYAYPTPVPSRVIQRAYREGTVDIENWSLYSIQQRLMAGALGVGFMPTKSIANSSMAEENRSSFTEIEDPFDSQKRIGVVKALNPDIALIHGLAADPYGNTILSPVSQDTLWGARASLGGVVVTVERIVSTDFIRRNSTLVGLPGYLVNSVSVCPLGAHPEGLYSNLDGVEGYSEDYDFVLEQRKASHYPSRLDAWIKEWVLDLRGHEDYLRKLGSKHILFLRGKAGLDSWKHELRSVLDIVSVSKEYNPTEMMIVAAARKIKERVKSSGYNVLLAGIGACGLAAWLAFYELQSEGYNLELAMGTGLFGYSPRPANPVLNNISSVPTSKMLTDVSQIYGFVVGGNNAKSLSSLGAAQIDKYGNINTTKVLPDTYLIGSGGSNDASRASEVLVMVPQSKRRCVEKVDYITSPGRRVRTLVTTMGIFERTGEGEFVLTGYFGDSRLSSSDSVIRKIKGSCGWELLVVKDVKEVPPPSEDELVTLRLFDPHGYFL